MPDQSKANSSSDTRKPSTGELREKLRDADMDLFDKFMRQVVNTPKPAIGQKPKAEKR